MKLKKFLSLGLAFVFSLSFVFLLPLNIVSAASSFPDTNYVSNFTESQSVTLLDQFYSNTSVINRGFDKYNSVICISYSSVLQLYNILCIKEGSFQDVSSYYYYRENRVCSSLVVNRSDSSSFIYGSAISSISSFDFSVNSSINPSDDFVGINFAIPYNNVYFVSTLNSSDNYKISDTPFSTTNWIYNYGILPPFEPDPNSYQLTGFIVGSDTSMEAFYNWILDNNKLSELPSYIVSSKLKSLIDFYHTYGGSLSGFIHFLPQWLSYVSLPSQTQENANILKNKLDSLYSEFINQYIVTVTRDRSQQLAHHRNGIYTVTDDSDTSLITDDVNDDTITSILRDILRGVIQITNSIYDNTSALIEKIDSINFTATVVNNGGVPSGTDINPLLQKMDDIIESLGSDTVSVEIDQTTQDDTDQFLSDWADEFSVELDSKFPVINQLGSLFSDDFFEKCGIDTDGDGEVFEYYNPEVALSRSAPASSESDIVSDFLNQFDDSDPAFLDNVSFSESVPDWSVSIAGSKVSVFSFKLYAKYRTWIHTIISFIIWTCFLLGLYKSLPGLIGNVANTFDVSHDIFDDKTASK